VVNLITLNITIAVLSTRYSALTEEFSREKYDQWLTKCLADYIFKSSLIRGGRCRAFLLYVRDFEQLSAVEQLQLRLMAAAEAFVSRRSWYSVACCIPLVTWFDLFCSGLTVWQRTGSGVYRVSVAHFSDICVQFLLF
jgi:hypothetical protein